MRWEELGMKPSDFDYCDVFELDIKKEEYVSATTLEDIGEFKNDCQ